jgi:hypothetical protein
MLKRLFLIAALSLTSSVAWAGAGSVLKVVNGSTTDDMIVTYLGQYCMHENGENGSNPQSLAVTYSPGATKGAYIEAEHCLPPFSDVYFTVEFETSDAAGCFVYQLADNLDLTEILGMRPAYPTLRRFSGCRC